jgi:hypothetical protein
MPLAPRTVGRLVFMASIITLLPGSAKTTLADALGHIGRSTDGKAYFCLL